MRKKPAHADHAQSHTELAADHLAHHLPCPQREFELQLAGIAPAITPYSRDNCGGGQLRRTARHRPGLQRVLATLTVLRQPPVHRLAVKSHRRGHILRVRARPDLLDRPHPQHLERLVIQLAAIVFTHARLSRSQDQVGLLLNSLVTTTVALVDIPNAAIRAREICSSLIVEACQTESDRISIHDRLVTACHRAFSVAIRSTEGPSSTAHTSDPPRGDRGPRLSERPVARRSTVGPGPLVSGRCRPAR